MPICVGKTAALARVPWRLVWSSCGPLGYAGLGGIAFGWVAWQRPARLERQQVCLEEHLGGRTALPRIGVDIGIGIGIGVGIVF